MASLNKNIQTGNFIPGSEEYTRPEEIAIMGKYLRAGIQSLSDSLDLENDLGSPGIVNKAKIKNIKNLPGEETLGRIESNSKNKVKNLLNQKEVIQVSNKEMPEIDSFLRRNYVENLEDNSKKIILNKSVETIKSNEDGSKLESKDIRLYEGTYGSNPKDDKRIIPDSENKDPRFKELDTLLGGVHSDKYSSETLSRSITPTKDALETSNKNTTSNIFFASSDSIKQKKVEELQELSEKLKSDKNIDSLNDNSYELNKSDKDLDLSENISLLDKSNKEIQLNDNLETLENTELDKISLNEKLSELTSLDFSLEKLPESSEKIINEGNPELINSFEELIHKTKDNISLSEEKEIVYKDPREIVLSEYVGKLLDSGKDINSLETQKELLSKEFQEIILIDYLKETIKDERELKLAIDHLEEMPGEEKEMALETFLSELNKDLKKISIINGKYFSSGKEKSIFTLLNDLKDLISQIYNSNFIDKLNIPESLKPYEFLAEMLPTSKTSEEFIRQISNSYGISILSAEDLNKIFDELTNHNGNWGKKVAAYLSALLGKYEKLKKYLPKDEVEKFKKVVLGTYEDDQISSKTFIKDTNSASKETIIEEMMKYLRTSLSDKIYNAEKWITVQEIRELLEDYKSMIYNLSMSNQEYSKNATLKGAFKNIKTELIDNTWDTIKNIITSTLNGSLFGAASSLLTDKIKIPGHDSSYDITVRNIPKVVGFYDKKTSTSVFSGTPHSTPLEVGSVDMNTSGWFTRAIAKTREYSFKNNYLEAEGLRLTLKDLCSTDINSISCVEDLFDIFKSSEYMTAHARSSEGVMNGLTLSSNHVWEITIEPYLSKFNGYCTWLPFIQELNQINYRKHRVRTIYDKWIPVTSFELQDRRLVNKTLSLYVGEISYPVAMEHSSELRLTISDDSFKSFRTYFDKVAEVSTFESYINTEKQGNYAIDDAYFAKTRKFGDFCFNNNGSKSTFETINKNKFAVGMYKNLCFNICIYIMTPQYSTIRKFNLLCVMKDYSIEYSGETDSGPSDISVNFSIVGETNSNREYDNIKENELFQSSIKDLENQVYTDLLDDLNETANKAMDNMYTDIMAKEQTPLSVINEDQYDYEMYDSLGGMMSDGNLNRDDKYIWNPNGTELRYQ